MTLSRDSLKQALSPLFAPSGMPSGQVPQAVQAWTRAYASYGQAAVAGGTLPTPLVPLGSGGRFSDALDSSLRAMWTAAVWAGPGLVGTTAVVPPLSPALESIGRTLVGSRDPDLALSLITDALHSYTLSITVSVVPPSGTPSIFPLT